MNTDIVLGSVFTHSNPYCIGNLIEVFVYNQYTYRYANSNPYCIGNLIEGHRAVLPLGSLKVLILIVLET